MLRHAVTMVLLLVLSLSEAAAQGAEPMLRIESETHNGYTHDAAADADGRVLVTVGNDKTARIWSLPDLLPHDVLRPPSGPGYEGRLDSVAVSPDGRLAAVGGWTGPKRDFFSLSSDRFSIFLFDLGTQRIVHSWGGLPSGIASLAFSSDGGRLAAGLGGGKGVRVFKTNGDEIFGDATYYDSVDGLANGVWGLSFAPDGRLAAAAYDGVRLYGPAGLLRRAPYDKINLPRPERIAFRPFGVAFSPNGQELAVGLNNANAIEILDGRTLAHQVRPDIEGVNGASYSNMERVAWSTNGEIVYGGGVASGGVDSSLVFAWGERRLTFAWDGRGRGKRTVAAEGFNDNIGRIVPLPTGQLAVMSLNGEMAVVDASGARVAERKEIMARFNPPIDLTNAAWHFYVDHTGRRVVWSFFGSEQIWHSFDAASLASTTTFAPPSELTDWTDHNQKLQVTDWRARYDTKLNGSWLHLFGEVSRAVAVEDDRVLSGTASTLRLFSSEGAERWRQQLPGDAWHVNQSPDGRLAIAALGDGTIRWYRLDNGEELLALFITRDADRWVAFTPSGYYAASPGGEDLFGWQVNRGPDQAADFFPASRFRDRFYRPDVIRLVLQTLDEDAALRQANAASDRNEPRATPSVVATLLPPVLDLVSSPTRFATDRVTVQYRVRAPADAPMIGDPRIKVNGEWQPKSRAATQVAADGTRDLIIGPLPPRDSTVEIYADNRNARSVPLTLALKWNAAAALSPGQQGLAAERKPHLFVLAVGVSQYQREDLRLSFADHDAEKFVVAMEAQRGKRYAEVTTKLLVNGDATLVGVKAGLAWLASQAAADDVGVLFLAGHGVRTPDQAYSYAPADFDPVHQHETGVDDHTIRRTLDTFSTAGNRALFFVDTCYAGGAFGPNLAASNGAALIAALSEPDHGIVVLSASTGDQLSYEDPEWRDGAFTTALLEGIVDAKADAAQSGEITLLNLSGYVTQRVRVLTYRRQEPMLIIPGGGMVDFVLATH
jgi:WD40 repeat protein